jgi:hypothetical protein
MRQPIPGLRTTTSRGAKHLPPAYLSCAQALQCISSPSPPCSPITAIRPPLLAPSSSPGGSHCREPHLHSDLRLRASSDLPQTLAHAPLLMKTSFLCIQCKDRSLEHVHDSWISRYVLTLSIVFQNLHLVPCICY